MVDITRLIVYLRNDTRRNFAGNAPVADIDRANKLDSLGFDVDGDHLVVLSRLARGHRGRGFESSLHARPEKDLLVSIESVSGTDAETFHGFDAGVSNTVAADLDGGRDKRLDVCGCLVARGYGCLGGAPRGGCDPFDVEAVLLFAASEYKYSPDLVAVRTWMPPALRGSGHAHSRPRLRFSR